MTTINTSPNPPPGGSRPVKDSLDSLIPASPAPCKDRSDEFLSTQYIPLLLESSYYSLNRNRIMFLIVGVDSMGISTWIQLKLASSNYPKHHKHPRESSLQWTIGIHRWGNRTVKQRWHNRNSISIGCAVYRFFLHSDKTSIDKLALIYIRFYDGN